MLLQFTIENFLSFRDRTVLSMLADPRAEHTSEQIFTRGGHQALRMAAFYGANASGKSNLIKAFAMVRRVVVDGTAREGERFPITPYKLDAAHSDAPTHVEVDFILDDVHYSYGFEASAQQVYSEWLYRIDATGETPLFTREAAKGASIVLGALSEDSERLRFLSYVAIGTRENQLFVAEAGRLEVPELATFRQYFRDWAIVWPRSSYGPLLVRMDHDKKFLAAMAELLGDAGTGIAGLRTSKRLIEDPPEGLADLLGRDPDAAGISTFGDGQAAIRLNRDRQLEIIELWTTHGPPHAETTELNIREESDGTRRLLNLAPLLHDLDSAHVLCAIDELDRSLHPLITRLFLERFRGGSQKGAAQLIFTTHDTNILDFKILSRDSIGFVEKDVSGRSITYPLSELNQAQVDEVEQQGRLEAGYLDGRFGAIPFLGIRKRPQR